jgi:phasin family protein
MSFNQERLAAANQAFIDSLNSSISTTLNGVSLISALNLNTTQAVLADVSNQLKTLSSVRDLKELQSLQSALLQPGIDKTVSYLISVQQIAREVQNELVNVVQVQFGEFQKQTADLLEQVTGFAPAGSEAVVAGVRSAFEAANSAIGKFGKVEHQFADIAQANLAAAGNVAARAVKSASFGKNKAA